MYKSSVISSLKSYAFIHNEKNMASRALIYYDHISVKNSQINSEIGF